MRDLRVVYTDSIRTLKVTDGGLRGNIHQTYLGGVRPGHIPSGAPGDAADGRAVAWEQLQVLGSEHDVAVEDEFS